MNSARSDRNTTTMLEATIGTRALALAPACALLTETPARAEDGDTVAILGTRTRLQDVDTSESAQLCQDNAGESYRCGRRAAPALADKLRAAGVAREPVEPAQGSTYPRRASTPRADDDASWRCAAAGRHPAEASRR